MSSQERYLYAEKSNQAGSFQRYAEPSVKEHYSIIQLQHQHRVRSSYCGTQCCKKVVRAFPSLEEVITEITNLNSYCPQDKPGLKNALHPFINDENILGWGYSHRTHAFCAGISDQGVKLPAQSEKGNPTETMQTFTLSELMLSKSCDLSNISIT